ncbi:MAG: AtzE family amidohydrolase [Dehalococcoidia bacterium]|nr:AtzE family amidohydrolase [Dehalococcoidia bacterium]
MIDTVDFTSTATQIAAAVARREVSARDVLASILDRIAATNPRLNAFSALLAERALARSARIDDALARNEVVGPLAGVPFAAKNLYDIEGIATLAGSAINRERPPATRDAAVVRRLEAAGAILLGAANMGEYAYDFTGRNAHYGASRNPHDPERMTGGSSSGSASAVAAGMVPLALGSDTNGSIRVPAAFCGLFGLKPTYGRLSRAGTYPFTASLDHVGPLARSTADLAAAYDAMQGFDADDAVCVDRAVEPTLATLDDGIDGLRIAIAGGYFAEGGAPEAFAAVAHVADALGVTRVVELPESRRARAAAFVITSVEGANLHLDRLRARPDDFDPETRPRFLAGALVPGAWYMQAQRFRRWYQEQVRAVFREVDVIIAPSAPVSAPLIEQQAASLGGVEIPLRANLGIFTQPISFIGLPVVAVPVWLGTMPMGVQIIAAPWAEQTALRVAAHLERLGAVRAPVAQR